MVEVTIVANESNISEEERARLQRLANRLIAEENYSIRELLHYLGMKEKLNVCMYGNTEDGIALKCYKSSAIAKVATA